MSKHTREKINSFELPNPKLDHLYHIPEDIKSNDIKLIQIDYNFDEKFKIGDKVKIIELERTGRIISIWKTASGNKYDVRYFDNAEARQYLFFEDELEKV